MLSSWGLELARKLRKLALRYSRSPEGGGHGTGLSQIVERAFVICVG